MKSRLTILMIVAAALCPTLAYAAEGDEPSGSFLVLILYAINFLLFLWLVSRFGWPMIVGFFQNRARTIRDTVNGAEKAYRDAQELANRAAEQLARVEAEKQRIASELADETTYIVGRIGEAATEAVQRLTRDNDLTATALREAAQRRVRQAMADAAGRLARQLLARDFRPADQTRLLEGFVERIDQEARS